MVSLEEVIHAYRKLEKLEPKNRLLLYIRIESEASIAWPVSSYNEFREKYVMCNPRMPVRDINEVYLSELVSAVSDAEIKNKFTYKQPQNQNIQNSYQSKIVYPKGSCYQPKLIKP